MIEALRCPTCGGPVHVRAGELVTICLYCNGALKIARPESGEARVELDPTIPGETIERIKELIVQGRRVDAVALYREAARCEPAAAEAAIETYVRSAVSDAVFSGTLNAFGVVLYVAALAFVVGGVAGAVLDVLPTVASVVLIVLGAINLLVLTRAAVRTVRYLAATRGQATILRHALIGRSGDVSSFRLLLDVREPSGETFRAEVAFAASKTGAEKVRVGRRFHVKYFPGDPKSVVFDGNIDE